MSGAPRILVIDGDEAFSTPLIARLERDGLKPQLARNTAQARVLLRSLRFEAVVSDVHLPDGDGEQIYREALAFLRSTPIIFTTAPGHVDQAVRLVKAGAADCLQKPCDIDELMTRLRGVIAPRQGGEERSWPEPVIESEAMRELAGRLKTLAATNFNLLVTGESGSGKEIVARHIHRLSSRCDEPFVVVGCATLGGAAGDGPLSGDSVRLLGDGGSSRHGGALPPGALEAVGTGTLFLDGVEELPLCIQARLTRLIDDRRFHGNGEECVQPFEARILAASDLSSAGLRERLRPQLFHRLAVVEIEVPPLRARRADLGPLVDSFAREAARDLGVPVRPLDSGAMAAVMAYEWPGNARELRNRMIRATSFAKGARIGVKDLFSDLWREPNIELPAATLEETCVNAERQRIFEVLDANGGRIGQAATSLGISRVTLWTKMKKLGLSNNRRPARHRGPAPGDAAVAPAKPRGAAPQGAGKKMSPVVGRRGAHPKTFFNSSWIGGRP